MKLVKCHITGFGRLCDFKYDFDPKVNNIFEENGWGKTTFSAFIKAMFYGLKYSPKLKSKFLDRNEIVEMGIKAILQRMCFNEIS